DPRGVCDGGDVTQEVAEWAIHFVALRGLPGGHGAHFSLDPIALTAQVRKDQRHGDEVRAGDDQAVQILLRTAAARYDVQDHAPIDRQQRASRPYRASPPPPQARRQQWEDDERRERALWPP